MVFLLDIQDLCIEARRRGDKQCYKRERRILALDKSLGVGRKEQRNALFSYGWRLWVFMGGRALIAVTNSADFLVL